MCASYPPLDTREALETNPLAHGNFTRPRLEYTYMYMYTEAPPSTYGMQTLRVVVDSMYGRCGSIHQVLFPRPPAHSWYLRDTPEIVDLPSSRGNASLVLQGHE